MTQLEKQPEPLLSTLGLFFSFQEQVYPEYKIIPFVGGFFIRFFILKFISIHNSFFTLLLRSTLSSVTWNEST